MTDGGPAQQLRATLVRVAPGTEMRDGLDRILRGRTGSLIVLGYDDDVEAICDGGFALDVEFNATRIRELSKMDGAVVLSPDAGRIVRANVHLFPDSHIPTEESGTRHRTAQRTAVHTGYPVVSVSQSMSLISVYVNGRHHVLHGSAEIMSRANQALATLQRYKTRADEVTEALSRLEIEDFVTVRDAMTLLQRLEMVRRISAEIEDYVVELGTDGRLIELQLDELTSGVDVDRELVAQDYLPTSESPTAEEADKALTALATNEGLDLSVIAEALGYEPDALDEQLSPRGHRVLSRLPGLPDLARRKLVDHFGTLQSLLGATAEDLRAVTSIGESRARVVREGLSRLAESSIH